VNISATILRAIIIAASSGTLLLAYFVWAEKRVTKVGWILGIVVFLAVLAFRTSLILLGGIGSIYVLRPAIVLADKAYIPLFSLPGILIGAWASSIGIQLMGNVARFGAGKPLKPLVWVNETQKRRRARPKRRS